MASDPRTYPIELDLDRTRRQLRIRWADEHRSTYPLELLRRRCPCAACRTAREQMDKNPLPVVLSPKNEQDMVVAVSASLVGHYALKVVWKDGHDTGIFDFVLLRALCPCEKCVAGGPAGGF